jgi:hypothetical protein
MAQGKPGTECARCGNGNASELLEPGDDGRVYCMNAFLCESNRKAKITEAHPGIPLRADPAPGSGADIALRLDVLDGQLRRANRLAEELNAFLRTVEPGEMSESILYRLHYWWEQLDSPVRTQMMIAAVAVVMYVAQAAVAIWVKRQGDADG